MRRFLLTSLMLLALGMLIFVATGCGSDNQADGYVQSRKNPAIESGRRGAVCNWSHGNCACLRPGLVNPICLVIRTTTSRHEDEHSKYQQHQKSKQKSAHGWCSTFLEFGRSLAL